MMSAVSTAVVLGILQLCVVEIDAVRSDEIRELLSFESDFAANLSSFNNNPLVCKRELSDLYCCGSAISGTCKDGRRQVCAPDKAMKCGFEFAKGSKCKCVSNHCYNSITGNCHPVDSLPITVGTPGREQEKAIPLASLEEVFAEGKVVSEADADAQRSSLFHGGIVTRLVGSFAHQLVFGSDSKFEKWLQWSISNFLLCHDDPQKNCDRGSTILNVRPDVGKCHFNFVDATNPDTPLWNGPIFPYNNGKGLSFNISLSVKLAQLRCLEAIKVEKTTCHGNVLATGGYCDVELTPDVACPLRAKDLEIDFYCEGHCEVNQHVMSLLHDSKDFDVGDNVYIEKYKQAGVPAEYLGTKLNGCSSRKMKVVKRMYQCTTGNGCSRFCVADAATEEPHGCWTMKNLLHESDCGYARHALRWVANLVGVGGGTKQDMYQVTAKRSLLYRKFDVVLSDHMSLSLRTFIYKTRSMPEIVDEEDDVEEKSKIVEAFSPAFNTFKRGWQRLRHPIRFGQRTERLIKKYKLNTVDLYSATGQKIGEELITCTIQTWNGGTRSYDQPPLEKCYKIRVSDLEIRSHSRNYLTIEEDMPDSYEEKLGMTSGYVLSVVAHMAQMLISREIVTVQSIKDGQLYFCKDEWSSKDTVLGLSCDSDEHETTRSKKGSPVKSEFFFEFIELPPVWNQDLKRNQMQVAIRGGYKLNFCQVFGGAGHVVCNVDLPTPNGAAEFDINMIPPAAKFLVEHVGKNDLESKVVIESGTHDSSTVSCSSGGSLETCPEVSDDNVVEDEIDEEWNEDNDRPESLQVRLKSLVTMQYCTSLRASRILLACNSPGSEGPSANLLTLNGNVDPLTPNKRWEHLIVISMTCLGFAAGLSTSAWASLFGLGGIMYTFTNTASASALGYLTGHILTEMLKGVYIDGIYMRYLVKQRMQAARANLLWQISKVVDFELPRY